MTQPSRQIDPSRRQFRWAVLLLSGAVILPTVCLLWFMSQAMVNVKSAARERQVDAYRDRITGLRQDCNHLWLGLADWSAQADALAPPDLFRAVLEGRSLTVGDRVLKTECVAGVLIYRTQGDLIFPALALGEPEMALNEAQMFSLAWRFEHTLGDYLQAAREYTNAARSSEEPAIQLRAQLGAIRCFTKAKQKAEAIALSRQLLASPLFIDSTDLAQQITHLRVQLVEQLVDDPALQDEYLRALLYRMTSYSQEQIYLPPPIRIYFLKKALVLADRHGGSEHEALRKRAQRLLKTERLCADLADRYPHTGNLGHWPDYHLRSLDPNESYYGFQVNAAEKKMLVVMEERELTACLETLLRASLPAGLQFRLRENGHIHLDVEETVASPTLLTVAFCDYLPGWTLEVLHPSSEILDAVARRQVTTYLWTGSLVIGLLLVLGLILTGTLRRQIRLNRLKNDFIATVTHELKTPLASMRLLVDTLLEGRYRDQQQVTEYLQLVSKENLRLTGLIDNFLTFSRMERNKQAFTRLPTSARDIALDAAAATGTKLQAPGIVFHLDVPETLPMIEADRDALVTVLVNLLDNAVKYAGEEKEISLRAHAENGRVCFMVKDNGWGIPKRVQQRIFSKFFQVDRSLTRRCEGCGLGLSIVKFIIDAHPGATVSVESKVDVGSTFTVCFPETSKV